MTLVRDHELAPGISQSPYEEAGYEESRHGKARHEEARYGKDRYGKDRYEESGRPATFALHGRTWDLLPGGGPARPEPQAAAAAALKLLGFGEPGARPRTGSFLEVGSGAGVVAVCAALAGHERVVATDGDPRAVRTTALNAARHGLAHRVRAVEGELFSGLRPGERFSTVYWRSEHACHWRGHHGPDPADYAAHRRYLTEAPGRTETGGTALLHFTDRGDVPGLWDLAEACGRELRVLRGRRVREAAGMVEHLLFGITVAPAPAPGPPPRVPALRRGR